MSHSTRFLDACYRRPVDCTPVWLMRQAGRYQASYRMLRSHVSFMELCKTPELAAQVTLNATRDLGVDAAIIFSDILIPLEGMGAPIELAENGPVITSPIHDENAVEQLHIPDPTEAVPYLLEAIRITRSALKGSVPLIGFAGGPLTLATYLIEGGSSKHNVLFKQFLFQHPRIAHLLFQKLATTVTRTLQAQVEAGCQAIQLFDSWAGILAPEDYREFVLPYNRQIFSELASANVPRILFSTSSATLLELMAETGAEVISLDWRIGLEEARRRLGPKVILQGNLDPGCLFMEQPTLEERIQRVLAQAGDAPGYIFNLGHGVLPGTPEKNVKFLVDSVHALTKRAK